MAFHGRVALVTGGGSGMGRLAAQRLAAAGAKVAALDVSEAGLAETRAVAPDAIWTRICDVTQPDFVDAVVAEAERDLGPPDRVMNAAGIMPTGLLLEQPLADIHRAMAINFGGVVNVTKRTLPGMIERGRGDLVQFASMAGWMPTLKTGAYNASKFAVVAFSEVLFHENRGKGVRMACVCPPAVATPMFRNADRPRTFAYSQVLAPERVLDEIERCLDRGTFWCFGGAVPRLSWLFRRFFPGLAWAAVHRIERSG